MTITQLISQLERILSTNGDIKIYAQGLAGYLDTFTTTNMQVICITRDFDGFPMNPTSQGYVDLYGTYNGLISEKAVILR